MEKMNPMKPVIKPEVRVPSAEVRLRILFDVLAPFVRKLTIPSTSAW